MMLEENNFILEEKEEDNFDLSVYFQSLPFTQAEFYANWQISSGRKVRRFVVKDKEKIVAFIQAIEYPLMFGKRFVYIPYGPVIKDFSKELIYFIKNQLKDIYKEKAVFIRFDFTPSLSDKEKEDLNSIYFKAPNFAQKSAIFQPRLEWVLSLDKSEQEIFDGMHKNTRYGVRTAEKRGVKSEIIKEDFLKYFDSFYTLMKETGERNDFRLHPKEYYQIVFESIEKNKNGFLVISKIGEEIVVAELFIISGDTVTYLFAGSSDKHRSSCPTYLAQWSAIKYSKQLGAKFYSFGGVSEENDEKTGWQGLSNFKRKFGGFELKHSDFYDLIVNYFFYLFYLFVKIIKK